MLRPKSAKLLIVLLGFIFISVAISISIMFDFLDVIPIGIGIVGIFLIILPFTYQADKKR